MATLHPVTGEVIETEALRTEGLAQLRAAIAAAPFKLVRDDNQFLLPFLRARKYEIPRCLKVLKTFCAFWYSSPGVVEGLCGEKVRETYELGFLQMLWSPDNESERVVDDMGNSVTLFNVAAMDYTKVAPDDQARLSLYLLLPLFEDESMSRHGLTICETFEGFSMQKAAFMAKKQSSEEGKKMTAIGLDTFPMRIRRIFVIKQPSWFNWFWTLVKFFFRKKLRDRLVLLGDDVQKLHTIIPANKLPAAFGGTAVRSPSVLIDSLVKVEREKGQIGGFALPLQMNDPTGSIRRAAAIASGTTVVSLSSAAVEVPAVSPTVEESESPIVTSEATI